MAIDLVCGMIVDEKSPPDITSYEGKDYFFCATHCREAFNKEPEKYIEGTTEWGEAVDPVCGMTVEIPTIFRRSLSLERSTNCIVFH